VCVCGPHGRQAATYCYWHLASFGFPLVKSELPKSHCKSLRHRGFRRSPLRKGRVSHCVSGSVWPVIFSPKCFTFPCRNVCIAVGLLHEDVSSIIIQYSSCKIGRGCQRSSRNNLSSRQRKTAPTPGNAWCGRGQCNHAQQWCHGVPVLGERLNDGKSATRFPGDVKMVKSSRQKHLKGESARELWFWKEVN